MPAAYLLTYSTYGSHLHGDERGSFRAPSIVQTQSAALVAQRQSTLKSSAIWLDEPRREAVLRAIVDTCRVRRWHLDAAHVRTEHAHVVVRALERPEPIMSALKAWATRYLRDARLVADGARVWTRHGSTRWLWNEDEIVAAAKYVHECQGEPMSRYP